MSTKRAVLFVQGGGEDAHQWDAKIVDRLQAALGPEPPVAFPFIRGLEELDAEAMAVELGDALRALPPGAIVVAHSLGASAVLKLFCEGFDPRLAALFLLAPLYNGADGEWAEEDLAMPSDFAERLPRGLPIAIWHSDDDEFVPADNSRRFAEKLPQAKVHFLSGYGHQFTQPLTFLADAIRGAST